MARPLAAGMDYFPLNTNLDDKFSLIEAKYGLEGFAIIIKLYQKIYKDNGYFYPWTDRAQLLFCKEVNVDINRVNAIINDAVEYELFSKNLFYEFSVLTSSGIQKRYFVASKRRKTYTLYTNLLLIDPVLNAEAKIDKRVYACNNPVNVCNNTHTSGQNACNGTESERGKRKEEILKEESETPFSSIPDFDDDGPTEKRNVYTPNDSSTRIEELRIFWNSKGLPEMRRTFITFADYERTDCLRIISAYTNVEIQQAIENYTEITTDPKYEYDSKYQYKTFNAFMSKGVEKFISSAKPLEAYLKKGATPKKTPTDFSEYDKLMRKS